MAYKDMPDCRPGSEGNTRLLAKYGGGSTPPRQSYPKGYANGGAVSGYVRGGGAAASGAFANGGAAMDTSLDAPEDMPARPRLDRPGKKKGKGDKSKKGTNVNVIVMPKEAAAPPIPPGVLPVPGVVPPGGPAPGPMPPMPIPGGPGMGPPMGPPGAGGPPIMPPMRARGGRVGREGGGACGAGGGKGRLDKMKAYGK